ncbi:MAG TPA: polysaccharide deacetylase family protein, partial [Symbiobacteriaceae bacterium]|nr:polysaccharide deacetylase family protein [Symbiobacteriaceae bacterium]
MARAIVPVLVAAALMLTACSKANAPTAPGSDPTPATPVVQTPATPSQGGSDPQDSETRGQDAPSGKAPVGSGTAPVPPVKVEPQIKWYSRGIGLPLTSDDPAAQGKKVVVLTFDDGPSDSGSTASVLDSLKAHNVKAMFFITGYGARNRDLVERIHKEGHVLGPHSMTHANLSRLPLA